MSTTIDMEGGALLPSFFAYTEFQDARTHQLIVDLYTGIPGIIDPLYVCHVGIADITKEGHYLVDGTEYTGVLEACQALWKKSLEKNGKGKKR